MKKLFEKKWILYLSLTLCLVLAFVPVITHYASAGTAVASVTIGDTTTEYDSLDAAVQAVANCTAEDKAVLKLLQSIDFGEYGGIDIDAGVCTLDLNGRTLSHATVGVQNADVTIIDSHGGGAVIASEYWNAVSVGEQAVVTINGGTFTAYGNWCVYVWANGTGTGTALNIKAGTINCDNIGVYCAGGDLTISGGNINGEKLGLYIYECDSIDIRGGIISGGTYSWRIGAAWEPWRVYKVNIGATFSGDIDGGDYTLEALLGEGAAYWLNGEKVTLKENQTVLTGGDIVVMNAGGHRHIAETYTNNGEDHTFTCATCGKEITEAHSYDETTLLCPCGAVSAEAVALVSKNGVPTNCYTTLNDAIQAVSTATAEDKAVLKLLQDTDLGSGSQWITAGVFTLDLNGKKLTSTNDNGTLVLSGAAVNVTISDSNGSGRIEGEDCIVNIESNAAVTIADGTIFCRFYYGVKVHDASLTVTGGRIESGFYGVYADQSTVTVLDGYMSACGVRAYGMYLVNGSIAAISGGTITSIAEGTDSFVSCGVGVMANSSVTVSGGTIAANAKGADGIYIGDSTGSAMVVGGSISGYKDGVYNNGTITIQNGVITGTKGPGINSSGKLNVQGGTITGNYGLYTTYGTVDICGGVITGTNNGIISFSGTGMVTISGNAEINGETAVYMQNADLIVHAGSLNGGTTGIVIDGGSISINGGNINGGEYGLVTQDGYYVVENVSVHGGTLSGKTCGWRISSHNDNGAIYKLTVNEDGVGATFCGGIDGYNTPLESLLGEGAAYWLNGEKVTLTEGQKVLTGGDVVIMSANAHKHSGTDYTNNGEDHTFTCATCGKEITEAHSYDETTLLCSCGAVSADAVVLVSKNGVPTSGYTTLNDAIQAVSTATADDNAVVKLLQDNDLFEYAGQQFIGSGVFTIDLNGKYIGSTFASGAILNIDGSKTNVTIIDSGEGGWIGGNYGSIQLHGGATVTILGGTFSGVGASKGNLTIAGGTISGATGVTIWQDSTANISGGNIVATDIGVELYDSTLTISGGTISAPVDIKVSDSEHEHSTITLTRGEKGVGATFVGGITVEGITLEEILGEGAVYWQCGKPVILTEGQTEITGCDVTVMDINTYLGIKGDLDGDGDVDAEDLTILARYVAGIITEWP